MNYRSIYFIKSKFIRAYQNEEKLLKIKTFRARSRYLPLHYVEISD